MIIVHSPGANVDYQIDWQSELSGDSISSSNWVVSNDLTKGADSYTTNKTTVWLSASANFRGRVTATNTIVTAAGRTEVKVLEILVQK